MGTGGTFEDRLRELHHVMARQPLSGAVAGVFPYRGFGSEMIRDRPVIVVDTNSLRGDVRRLMDGTPRPLLVNAANTGALLVLCPAHVAEELFDHAEIFCEQFHRSSRDRRVYAVDRYLEVLNTEMLPVFRIVEPVGDDVFTAAERERLAALRERDPDDVPAAELTIVCGAEVITSDGPLLDTVYGAGNVSAADSTSRDRLLPVGDLHQVSGMLAGGAAVVSLAGFGIRSAVGRAMRSPAGAVALSAATMAAWWALRRSDRARAAGIVIATTGVELMVRYTESRDSVRPLPALEPTEYELAGLSDQGRLARECVRVLCRSAQPTLSAREMRDRLAPLPVPSGEAKVRAVLRSRACFTETSPGRFQLGRPHSPSN